MTRRALSLLLLFAAPLARATATAPKRAPVGLVQRLEVSSITRDRVSMWLHVALAEAPKGSRGWFDGKFELANVEIPYHAPARVMFQPGGGPGGAGADAVFFLDVDLASVPEALLSKAGAHGLDFTVNGSLTGNPGDVRPVFAVGVLRLGTGEVKTPPAASPDFLRFAGARLTDVSLSETSGEANVVLYNPFSFPVPIREVSYQLYVGDRLLASGTKRAVRLRGRQETTVPLPVSAGNMDLAAVAGSALLSGGVVEGRLVGSITVKVASGDVTVPINLPGRVEIRR